MKSGVRLCLATQIIPNWAGWPLTRSVLRSQMSERSIFSALVREALRFIRRLSAAWAPEEHTHPVNLMASPFCYSSSVFDSTLGVISCGGRGGPGRREAPVCQRDLSERTFPLTDWNIISCRSSTLLLLRRSPLQRFHYNLFIFTPDPRTSGGARIPYRLATSPGSLLPVRDTAEAFSTSFRHKQSWRF